MAMHVQDGWYAERLESGGVRIRKLNAFGIESERLDMTPEGWASVVASVSKGGEEAGRFYVAKAFHMGTEIGCECPIDDLHRLNCVLGINPPPAPEAGK